MFPMRWYITVCSETCQRREHWKSRKWGFLSRWKRHIVQARLRAQLGDRSKYSGERRRRSVVVASNFPTILHGRDAILRVRDKLLISNMILQLWADVKYHVPTGFGFSPKASGFYSFGDATDLAGEGGVGDVVWLIQATASNHKPKTNQRDGSFGLWFMWFDWNQTCHSTNDRCEALASLKGCFLCFCFSTASI